MRADVLSRTVAEELKGVTDSPEFEARCLVSRFYSIKPEDIYLAKEIADAPSAALKAAIKKRKAHYPLQYILGSWEFMGFEFFVNENVLIPRPETELLCECLLEKINPQSVVYDVCAGSGCIGISLAKLSGAGVYAFEKYEAAIKVLQTNVRFHAVDSVHAIQYDVLEEPKFIVPKADFLFANPPYIESALIPHLQEEVRLEPHTALDGGEDGLVFYRAIAKHFGALLKIGAYAAFEIGEGQEEDVKQIFSDFTHLQTLKDYNHIKRVVVFRKDNE